MKDDFLQELPTHQQMDRFDQTRPAVGTKKKTENHSHETSFETIMIDFYKP